MTEQAFEDESKLADRWDKVTKKDKQNLSDTKEQFVRNWERLTQIR